MRLIMVFLALFFVLCGGAQAEEGRLYRVTDVNVDLAVDAATFARDAALTQAQGEAFARLLERLSYGAKADLPEKDELAAMVSSFDIQKEHITGKRYIGTFAIQFVPEKIRAFLEKKKLPFREIKPVKLLILPVTIEGERKVLWEEDTPWRAAWRKKGNSGLIGFVLPEGDLQDIAQVSSSEVANLSADKILPLVKKYKTDGALVGIYGDKGPEDRAAVRLLRVDADGKVYETQWVNEAGEDGKALPLDLLLNEIESKVEMQQSTSTIVPPGVFGPDSTKEPPPPSSGQLAVEAEIASLADWNKMQALLLQAEGVQGVTVNSLTRERVKIEIQTTKPAYKLQQTFAAQGLHLFLVGDGDWHLSKDF